MAGHARMACGSVVAALGARRVHFVCPFDKGRGCGLFVEPSGKGVTAEGRTAMSLLDR